MNKIEKNKILKIVSECAIKYKENLANKNILFIYLWIKKSSTNCPKSIDKPKKNAVYLSSISKFLSYRKINYENLIKKEEELLYFVLLKS